MDIFTIGTNLFLLISQVLGAVGCLPGIFVKLEVSYYLLKRLLGVRTEGDKKAAKVQKLVKNEVINSGTLFRNYSNVLALFGPLG